MMFVSVSLLTTEFKYQEVYSNYKDVKQTTAPDSKIYCSQYCLWATNNHQCTAFKLWNNGTCQCGILSPFVTGPPGDTSFMHVATDCKQSNMSGYSFL